VIKKGDPGDGFLLCFLLNLLFNFWWGLIAVILLILHFVLSIPLFLSFIGFFIWIGIAFLSTALVVWAVSTADEKTPHRENLNPYSAKNSDVFPSVTVPVEDSEDVVNEVVSVEKTGEETDENKDSPAET